MKKALLASVAVLGLATGAMAADLPATSAPPAPALVAVPPVFTWTGFYVGVNAGYGWVSGGNDYYDPTFGYVRRGGDDGGFVGGGQIGYNYQIGNFVIGAETDLQYADLGNGDFGTSDDWFGTVRVRAGVAIDRALVYATGGFAYADETGGWTIGGGVEYAFTNNLTGKVEGLYVNLNNDNGYRIAGATGFDDDNDTEFGVVRAGLNYKFGN